VRETQRFWLLFSFFCSNVRYSNLCDCVATIEASGCEYTPCAHPPTSSPVPIESPPFLTRPPPTLSPTIPYGQPTQSSPTISPTSSTIFVCLEEETITCKITSPIIVPGNLSTSGEIVLVMDEEGNGKIVVEGCVIFSPDSVIRLQVGREILEEGERIEVLQFNETCPSLGELPRVVVESEDVEEGCEVVAEEGSNAGTVFAHIYLDCEGDGLEVWMIVVIALVAGVIILVVVVSFSVPSVRKRIFISSQNCVCWKKEVDEVIS